MPDTQSASEIQEAMSLESLLQWLALNYGNAVRSPRHVAAIQALLEQQTTASMYETGPRDV